MAVTDCGKRMMAKRVRIGLDEIGEYIEFLEDQRYDINQKHPFVSIIVIAVMVILAGADGPTAIADGAECKSEFLLRHPSLPSGVPRKDVFPRVLSPGDDRDGAWT